MSTFTRLSDSATIHPVKVFGPFEVERESRTLSRELLHSTVQRITFVPSVARTGEYQLLFATHQDAKDAAEFFTSASLYGFDAQITDAGGWAWVDGYYINAAPATDTSFDATFIVPEGRLRISQAAVRKWELRVPFKEVTT